MHYLYNRNICINVLFVLFHVKFADCAKGFTPSPYNKRPLIKVVAPVPPLPIGNVPALALETFKLIKPAPEPLYEPLKFVAFNILFVLSHDKLVVCNRVFAPFPINKEPRGIVFKPVPPLETDKVPVEIFEAFKFVKLAPEPVKKAAVIVPVAVMSDVLIPPIAYTKPLKFVKIARE